MNTTTMIHTHWKWGLLALLAVLAAVLTAGAAPGRQVLELTPPGAEAAFPGANGKIAFTSNRDGNSEVYVMNADGSGQTNLTNNAAQDRYPAWSPDETQIAFQTDRDGPSNKEVYVMNADGGGQTNLTNNAGHDYDPAWSPDGTKIAFTTTRDGNDQIYVMNADGSGQTNISNNAFGDAEPAWSPDGSKIAFISTRDGNWEVYVMNADGSGQTNLTNNLANDDVPTWSADGTKIAFQTFRDGNWEVYVMNADGSGQTNLSNNAAQDYEPAWSPDGTKIAFRTDRDGNNEVYVMNANGSGQTNLTNNAAQDTQPDWQRQSISITNIGEYALPKTCFQVLNASQVLLFTVCDNGFQGPPATNAVCIPDGICDDDDTALGFVHVPVVAGAYFVMQSKVPYGHTGDATTEVCNSDLGCPITFVNTPNTKPWFPWDVTGDSAVSGQDFFQVLGHFNQTKP